METNNLSNIGSKIRKERRVKGFTQSDLSKKLEISASYLNLIESGRRTITVPLLIRIGNELGISLKDLTVESNKRLLSDVMDVLSNELFEDLDITNQETTEFISNNPSIAKALLTLNDSYKSFRDDTQNRLEKLDVESSIRENKSTRLPVEIVSDFLQENKNYFDSLEKIAEKIREKIYFDEGHRTIGHSLIQYLLKEHNIKVKVASPEDSEKSVKFFDKDKKILFLSEMLTYSARNFHLAYQIGYFDAQLTIDKIIKDNKIFSEELISLLKISLLNYFAAALLMPYDSFLLKAKKYKYDIEILMHHFAASFEQVTHRLTNLQRPGNSGVPFHFLKTDIAGNVSKRFSLSGIHIPRHGGSCPRWNVYIAFMNPGKIHPQISKMPDGKVYFCIARAFEKGIEKYGMPKSFVSIGLGCDVQYAKELTYSEGMDLSNKNLETPIGVSCRICPRLDCQQRAFPPIDKDLKLDIISRGTSPYITI
ncbi:MAG: HTH-type transcriptional regulator RamB [Alphaproteobacteria bacterium MarineAlpha5_Bin6]|nr:MAG: HTH-type transcriptional regulator RamB [Alphaproteobacteria bacterium MarineAlpha5_Bin6]|tara:strand:+ start:1337 stop:2776 length:1440 start_codon:yes stop_codon:yes gene_type:complete